MLRLQFDAWGEPPPRKIAEVARVLHDGGVAAYPTDSIYALGCALEARGAIEKIYRAKHMGKGQRLALICPDLATAAQYGRFSQTAFRVAQRVFPGPYTLVVPATGEVPRTLTDAKRRTVGLRVTSHPIAQALVRALGRPLLTTSAIDPETHAVCRDADEVLAVFEHVIDVLVDAPATNAEPSTVHEIDGNDVTVIREGQGPVAGILD